MIKVFLSYSREYQTIAESLAHRLARDGDIVTKLDSWNLRPEDPWQTSIEDLLDECDCCVLLVTDEPGPWQHEEMRHALEQRQAAGSIRVIGLLVDAPPSFEQLPSFLSQEATVRMADPACDAEAVERLLSKVRSATTAVKFDEEERAQPPRVRISYDVEFGDTAKKVELPFTILPIANYAPPTGDLPTLPRKTVQIDSANFDEVMKSLKPALKINTETKVADGDDDLAIELKFTSMNDFSPSGIAKNLPELRRLLGQRNKLKELISSLADSKQKEVLSAIVDDLLADRTIPYPVTDQVQFSVSAPPSVQVSSWYTLDTWVHTIEQRHEVLALASESQNSEGFQIKSKGPIRLARGTVLNVDLRLPDFEIPDAADTIVWDGEIGSANFCFYVPAKVPSGRYPGTVVFSLDQLQIARVHFVLNVGGRSERETQLEARQYRHRTAFASYSSEDRDEVLARIQGMQKVLPDLDVFVDVHALRSGMKWENRMAEEIRSRDVFYLFWSLAASSSQWVEKEWRTAIRFRGLDFIDPVPLVSPDAVRPPAELASQLHFNDWVLAFMRGSRD